MKSRHAYLIGLGIASLATAAAAQVPPVPWDGPGYGPPPYPYPEPPGVRDPRENKVQVQTFAANSPAVAALGHGPIVIAARAGAGGVDDGLFEAALADQLAHAGYQPNAPGAGQTIDFVVTHEVIQPPEPPHSPIHGGVGVDAGSRFSGVGLGIAIDLTKPLGALLSTRIEARIHDATTHALLWQGRAEVMTRENDKRWRPDAIAGRLTAALFRYFPRPTTR